MSIASDKSTSSDWWLVASCCLLAVQLSDYGVLLRLTLYASASSPAVVDTSLLRLDIIARAVVSVVPARASSQAA